MDLGILQDSKHPASSRCINGSRRGLFIQENCDRLGANLADESIPFIQEFLSEEGDTSNADEAGPQLDLPVRELFGEFSMSLWSETYGKIISTESTGICSFGAY